ncbi:hypothetical protein ACIRL2_45790 [Embleya sp. NPDC127516]|uniref:hypothetical protein n=1 Tax=Embleya sp. NPDC127516 TaxID=3363990 RepID=UPI0037FE2AB7
MSDLVPVAAQSLAATGGGDATRYGSLIEQLENAAEGMRRVSEAIDTAFASVGDGAASVKQLADTAAALRVDASTVGEHRDAATCMSAAHGKAESLVAQAQEMSTQLRRTAAEHRADYGPVTEAVQAMPVAMADRSFYANH